MEEEARKAEVTVLIGMGATPGLTNLLAKYAANQLDEVDDIQAVWGSVGGIRPPRSAFLGEEVTTPFEANLGPAGAIHMMYCVSRKTPVFRNGKFVEVIPLEDGEEVTFPNGKGFFWYYGHGIEPVTLPRFIKGLKGASNIYGISSEELDVTRRLAARIRANELSVERATAIYQHELNAEWQQISDEPLDMGPRVGGIHATASGRKGGKRVKYGYGFQGAPSRSTEGLPRRPSRTAIPFALATEMIINGEISQRGVLAPEACIDPLSLFERYMKYWENPPENVEKALYEVVEEI
jgi:saccharopine dehydrogenase-like NADP-dependent oxidoreductase